MSVCLITGLNLHRCYTKKLALNQNYEVPFTLSLPSKSKVKWRPLQMTVCSVHFKSIYTFQILCFLPWEAS